MLLEELCIEVGARATDDIRKLILPGALVRPDYKHRDFAILLVTGFSGYWQDYIQHFAQHIGTRVPIYTTQLRARGRTMGKLIVDDLQQIDAHIRNRLETNNILYICHSMGAAMGAAAAQEHHKHILGFLGIAAYPSYGDCFNTNPDIRHTSLLQSVVDLVCRPSLGPFSYPLKKSEVPRPAHFVIADKDEIAYTTFPGVRRRFEQYFSTIGSVTVLPGNHCFNDRLFKLRPFNVDHPELLLSESYRFINGVLHT